MSVTLEKIVYIYDEYYSSKLNDAKLPEWLRKKPKVDDRALAYWLDDDRCETLKSLRNYTLYIQDDINLKTNLDVIEFVRLIEDILRYADVEEESAAFHIQRLNMKKYARIVNTPSIYEKYLDGDSILDIFAG